MGKLFQLYPGQKLNEVKAKIFCNRYCYGKWKGYKEREKYNSNPNKCEQCGKDILITNNRDLWHTKNKRFCDIFCKNIWMQETADKRIKNKTKAEVARQTICDNARRTIKHMKKGCKKCGYDKHVECCHIRPVADFPDTVLVAEINHKDNLVYLCPNCHWELDNGLIKI